MVISHNIYDRWFVFRAVLEDSYSAIEADCYQLSAIWSIGEEGWARSV